MVREFGPVLTGLMVAGRNSSGMASELGSMKVTEQIDAMRAMGVDPSKKLVTPRVVAAVVMLFFLSIISDLVGLTGGFMISYLLLGLDANQYWTTAYQSLRFGDVVMGLAKPAIFGFIIATIGCYYGLSAKGGTQGVGRATTQAVVAASVLILVSDFFLTRLADGLFPVLSHAKHRSTSCRAQAFAVRTTRPRSFASRTWRSPSIIRFWKASPSNCRVARPRS